MYEVELFSSSFSSRFSRPTMKKRIKSSIYFRCFLFHHAESQINRPTPVTSSVSMLKFVQKKITSDSIVMDVRDSSNSEKIHKKNIFFMMAGWQVKYRLVMMIFLEVWIVPIQSGPYDWLMYMDEKRNTECLLYGRRYFCHWAESHTELETKASRDKCLNGYLVSFETLRNQSVPAGTLVEWLIPFHLIEQYADFLSRHNATLMGDSLICNCSINYIGTNCHYKIPGRKKEVEDVIKLQRGTKINEHETLTSLIDQMKCRDAYPNVEWRQICDGIVNCENNADEMDCHLLEFHQCAEDEYQCRNGMCIPNEFLFDGVHDCLDLSDEQDLPELIDKFDERSDGNTFGRDERLCAKNQISCGDGQCVHWSALFHREEGCRNQRHIAFRCDMMNGSFPAEFRLNGICRQTTLPLENLTDESSCSVSLRHFLTVDRWQNISHQKMPMSLNNILRHCPEKIRYPDHSIVSPGLSTYYNRTEFEILHNSKNGFLRNASFQPHLYCFSKMEGCNYVYATWDENDEQCFTSDQFEKMILEYPFFSPFDIFCGVTLEASSESVYMCHNTTRSIARRRLNDGYVDCLYGDDEYNDLGLVGSFYRYRCENVSNPEQYISVNLLGNGRSDCRDGSDEMSSSVNWLLLRCDFADTYACWVFQDVINRISSIQLPHHRHCDTHWDTINGTDEKECSDWICNRDEYQCQRTGQCVDRKYVCDGEWDCPDGEDEFQNCSVGSRRWSLETRSCNATSELYCVTEDFLAASKTNRPCISRGRIADGHIDCVGGRDERNVFFCNDRQLLGDRFICDNQTKCLNFTALCNGIPDCLDRTDEQICAWDRKNCTAGHYACFAGTTNCVATRCSNKPECTDRSHWYWCPSTSSPFEPIYRKSKQMQPSFYRQKFCIRLPSTPRIAYAPTLMPVPSVFNVTGFCNRGYYLLNEQESKMVCFCPPSYYGSRCQYDQRRVDVSVRFDRQHRTDIPAILNVLVALVHNESQIVDHQYMYDVAKDEPKKYQIYLLYPRLKPTGTFSVRFEAYESTQLWGLWEYPISPLDFLPVFLMAKVLRFPAQVPPARCSANPCLNQGTCFTANNEKSVCFCPRGWQGKRCELRANQTKCAPNALARAEHVCICPNGYFSPHCLVRRSKCENAPRCPQNGSCHPMPHHPPDNYVCICDRYECQKTSILLLIHRNTSISSPFLIQLLKVSSDYPVIRKRILLHPATNFPTQRYIRTYAQRNLTETPPEIGVLLTFESLKYQVNSRFHSLYMRCASGSRNVTVDLDVEPQQCRRLHDNEYSSTKNVLKICGTSTDESCYLWMNYLCTCATTETERHNCIYYDERQTSCSYCYNQGYCVQGDLYNSSDFVCVCPRCASGDLCQDAPGKFSISFEYLFAKTQWGRYHFLVPSVFLICAITLNNLCLLTFTHPQARQSGTGIYLLLLSIVNQLIFINLFLCVLYLYFLERIVFSETINRFLCQTLSYSMSCLYFITLWLMAFITVDRAAAANYPQYFRRLGRPRVAVLLSILTSALVFTSMHPQIKLYKLIRHPLHDYHSCIRQIQADENEYTHYIQLLHQILPFIINLIAALLIILAISRSKARAHHLTARYAFQKQISKRKDLVIGPVICFITELPQVVLIFLDTCNYQSNIWFLDFFLAAFYVSFVPQLALFLLYLLPSPLYKHVLIKETTLGKRILSHI